MGFNNSPEIDIDKLIKLLEENHHLLQDIAINDESNQVSALPKVLLDLVTEVSDKENSREEEEEEDKQKASGKGDNHNNNIILLKSSETQTHQLNSASEIVENLPKVWKVLIELLSHQNAPITEENKENACYNMVDTPKGPHKVLSVSKTFIRLKVNFFCYTKSSFNI